MTSPSVPLADRITAQTDKGDGTGCWLWTGPLAAKNAAGDGYGHLAYQRKHLGAHRVAWEMANGRPVPAGMEICHSCDVRRCVRPDHLFLGTHKDNIRDAARKGRMHLGEADGIAKLKAVDIPLIRARYAKGVAYRQIAREYGVTDGAIRFVCARVTWAHVV